MQFDFNLNGKMLENAPLFVMIGIMVLTMMPIPNDIKSPIVIAGIVGAIPMLFIVDAIARVEASKYMPIKARIRPWNKEITFFCIKPVGQISSAWDPVRRIWKTPFKLGVKVNLPTIGVIDEIEIEHKRPWAERNMGGEGYVLFKGIETRHHDVILVELWIANPPVRVNMLKPIPQFRLASGSQDFWLLRGRPLDDIINLGD